MNGEVIAIRQFAELGDRVGLPIPGFHPFFRQDGFDLSNCGVAAVAGHLGTAEWPKPDMLELIAIAQHHGVPTRLLDFSFDPRIALFFAADDAVRNKDAHRKNGVTELAVWGANMHKLHSRSRNFKVVEVERSKNRFLQAQKGLFVIDLTLSDSPDDQASPSLDERVTTVFHDDGPDPVMVKVTMPLKEAGNALSLLTLEGIDRPHLMPTLDNVVSFLRGVGDSSYH